MDKPANSACGAFGRLDMELTERCNNNCLHCYINLPAGDPGAREKELSTAGIKNVLAQAVTLGYLSVRFTGGEPLLRDDFEELYLYARRAGLRVSVFTNGALITPRLVSLFERIPPLEPLEITVYGMGRASYEMTTRVPGSYKAAFRGIALLYRGKVPFVIKGTFLRGAKQESVAFRSWLASMAGIEGAAMESKLYLRCRRDDMGRNRVIRDLRAAAPLRLRLTGGSRERHMAVMKEFFRKFMRPPDNRLFDCGCGCGGGVDAQGRFQACMLLRHPVCVYDLKKGSLKKALERFVPRIRKMKAVNPDYLKRCARCFLKGLCEQCPANSWLEHGTLDTPVERCCEAAHAQARSLGLVRKSEKAWEVEEWRQRVRSFLNKGEYAYGK